jgi:hypothetical protein
MRGVGLGWRCHSGWAVLVVAEGTTAAPHVIARERVQLVDEPLPRMAYHAIQAYELSLRDGKALITKVRRAATAAATKATKKAAKEFGIETVAVVGKARNIPDDLQRILAAHSLLHAAEGALYEEVVLEAAARAGFPALLVEERTIDVSAALDAAGKALGPPWQKDHKLAATAALQALDG